MSLQTLFRVAFARNFNINLPTQDALHRYDRYIASLEKRIKVLEEKQ